jgi:hypothetical protein
MRTSVLESRLNALVKAFSGLSGRVAALERRAPIPGPKGEPGPQAGLGCKERKASLAYRVAWAARRKE